MNIISRFVARIALPSVIAAVLLLAGCLEQRVIWSPGGERAVVLTGDGDLYLCDGNGALTGKLARDVKLAAWLGDARRLVLARQQDVSDWATVSAALGADRGRIEALGQKILAALDGGTPWEKLSAETKESGNLVKIWLRDLHPTEVQPKLSADEWHSFRPGHCSVKLTTLVLANVMDTGLEVGSALHAYVGDVGDLRPSRDGRVLVWTYSASDDKATEIRALRIDDPARVVPIASRAAGYPDWGTDGRSLVYVSAPPGPAEDPGLAIGIVTRRVILDETGRIAPSDKPEFLAGVLFTATTRVRCLKDGRILFNAPEIAFPLAAADYEGEHREQLFAIDPARQSTVVRLIPRGRELDVPELLSFYDVSPDERQVLFAGFKNELAVLTLATGAVETLQGAGKDLFQGVPTWRSSGEICYVKVSGGTDNVETRPAEIVLRRGKDETVLSRTWPAEVLEHVADRQRR